MLSTVFTKSLYDQWKALLWWALAIVLLIATYVAIWPSMRDQPSMADFLNQMPEALRSLFATTGADLTTPVGYIQVELMSFMAPIVLLLYAIGRGVSAVAGEEEAHTLELLLSTPLARARIIAEKFAAMTVGVAFLAAVTGFSLVLEGSLADMNLPAQNVAAAMVHLGLLALVFGTLALVLSASTGRTGLSRGIPAALAVAAYAVNGLAPLVDWLEPLQKYSPFFQYAGHDPLRNGIDMTDVLVAAATCLVLVALAAIGFRSRDTAA
ncbi:ABC transporter permease subunit [Microbacterium rhizosphaerae]|uniref:ABC transporter permease subunit n=1 Tax=Microbacterium rhizosphaerae TaxID=1678237 RepID=A0ABZ0SMW8_9MICO|nr:ABC transporter permease subunit [Microbacterium rhizosphaerae]WPR88612.1 ABC transporter permease subunit [Microbacterium rhizosphaerae]